MTPSTAKQLLDAGYTVRVERSPVRIFDDEEFAQIGATLVPEHSWRDAPKEHLILGLKELPEEDCARHSHAFRVVVALSMTLSFSNQEDAG